MKYNTIDNNPWQRTVVTHPFVWWDNAFADEELASLIEFCEADGLDRAQIMGTDPDKIAEIEKIRRCDIKFFGRNEQTSWFFERMNKLIASLNDQFYGFELNGYDSFQYTSYNAEESGTYHWHTDTCFGLDGLPQGMIEPRKLSLTLLLNDDFEGGEFMINLGNEAHAIQVEIPKGRAILFPSFIIHSVKPVTKGFRKSIVIWVTGPKFR
jgi:PKHD-type hydroxylase